MIDDRNAKVDQASLVWFAVFFACSLVLTAATNRLAGAGLNATAPGLSWLATTACPSCMLICCLYARLGDPAALMWPRLNRNEVRQALAISGAWLALWTGGSIAASVLTGHWITYAHGTALVTAFLIFGPAGEEMLFRGLVFQRARQLWPATAAPAIYLSTVAFSLHHIAINAAPHELATAQILFTLPLGIVLATLRERTGSLWPGLLVHMATNFPAAL